MGYLMTMDVVAIVAVFIPIVALFIPIVAMLTKHQRDMAEIIHNQTGSNGLTDEIRALRGEIAELRERVNQQTVALDGSVGYARPPADLPERLQGTS